LLDKRTCAGVEDIEAFGEKLALPAAQRGAFKAQTATAATASLSQLRGEGENAERYALALSLIEPRLKVASAYQLMKVACSRHAKASPISTS
jgi:hypothetical protein